MDRGLAHRSDTVRPNTRRKIRRVQCRIRCTAGDCVRPMSILRLYNDLEGELKQRRLDVLIKKFADDTKGAKVIKGPEDRIKMQEALDCLCDWADRWGMSFNFSKCKVMHVGKKNPRYEYFMRGTQVSTTEEERDVGVLISSNLNPASTKEFFSLEFFNYFSV